MGRPGERGRENSPDSPVPFTRTDACGNQPEDRRECFRGKNLFGSGQERPAFFLQPSRSRLRIELFTSYFLLATSDNPQLYRCLPVPATMHTTIQHCDLPERCRQNLRGAPRNAVEQSGMRLLHADQIIAAILGRTDNYIMQTEQVEGLHDNSFADVRHVGSIRRAYPRNQAAAKQHQPYVHRAPPRAAAEMSHPAATAQNPESVLPERQTECGDTPHQQPSAPAPTLPSPDTRLPLHHLRAPRQVGF